MNFKNLIFLIPQLLKYCVLLLNISDLSFLKTKVAIKFKSNRSPWITKGIGKSSKKKQRIWKTLKNTTSNSITSFIVIRNGKIFRFSWLCFFTKTGADGQKLKGIRIIRNWKKPFSHLKLKKFQGMKGWALISLKTCFGQLC